MPFYPINLQIEGKPCSVIGGGLVAERKIAALLQAQAAVTVFSPTLTDELRQLVNERRIEHVDRTYRQGDLAGFFLVICATDVQQVNAAAAREAASRGLLVNVVDAPAAGNFQVPASIRRGDLLLTVSTGGKSPALARTLRRELAARYGEEYGSYLDVISNIRSHLKKHAATRGERERFWQSSIHQEAMGLLRQGKIKEAEAKIRNAIGSIGNQP